MSVMQVDRALAKIVAKMAGAFWLPCPSCGREFGGHEWTDVDGHSASIPIEVHEGGSRGKGICPDCTRRGVGCRAWAEHGRWHAGCEYAKPKEAA